MAGKRQEFQKNKVAACFLLPSLAGVLIFYLVPFLDVVRRSFLRSMGTGFAGWNNYWQVLTNRAFQLAAANTVRFVLVCLPLLLLLSLLLAALLNSRMRENAKHKTGKGLSAEGIIRSLYLVPMAIPAAGIVLLWKLVFDAHGFLNAISDIFGISTVDWMNTPCAFGVLVFTYIWKNLGYVVILWLAAMASIPESIYEAASVDGAGEGRLFFLITLPNLKSAAFTIVVLSFLNSFKVFREAYLVAGNYPQDSIYMLQHVFNNWFLDLSVDKMAAGSVLLALVSILLVGMLKKSWEEET